MSQIITPPKYIIPVIKPSLKADFQSEPLIATKRGTRANHARPDKLNSGNSKLSRLQIEQRTNIFYFITPDQLY